MLSTSHLAAMTEADEELGAAMSVAGGALNVDENDEAAVCGALFKGLVFYMGCELRPKITNITSTRTLTDLCATPCRTSRRHTHTSTREGHATAFKLHTQ